MSISEIVSHKFEILSEEAEEIKRDKIEATGKILFLANNAVNIKTAINNVIDKQNELIKAVKLLNKKIGE